MIAAVILAAGASDRLGRPKQLLPYRGRTLLINAVECAIEVPCEPVLVVLGAHAETVTPLLEGTAAETVYNKKWREGIGASIRLGIRTLQKRSPDVQAVLLLACDQPLLGTHVLRKLVKQFEGAEGRIVACEYADTVGIPTLFERSRFPELLELSGAAGAKSLLQRHRDSVVRVAWPEGAVDIDTSSDYGDLIEKNFGVLKPKTTKS